jgi:hypothetical protein
MSFITNRNKKRKEEIRKIKGLLEQGELKKISEAAGVSYRAAADTLNEKHPLFSQKVITAAWAFLEEEGRLPEKGKVSTKSL